MTRRPQAQALLGFLILMVGVAALLGQLGVVDVSLGSLLATWWPLAIVAVGLAALVSVPRAWTGPAVIIAVGVLFQLDNLGLVRVHVWDLVWPIAIILVGLALLTRTSTRGADANRINCAVIWWGADRRTRSQDFRGGSLIAIMGGIAVDLREAGIVERAEISVFVLWGGVEIKVPPTWRVEVSGLPLLGGWEDKTVRPLDPGAPELIVHVTSIMGGAGLRN